MLHTLFSLISRYILTLFFSTSSFYCSGYGSSQGVFELTVDCANPTPPPSTANPTPQPTNAVTPPPTNAPFTADPTANPTTAQPTNAPTTAQPTNAPTTLEPTAEPTLPPTPAPTNEVRRYVFIHMLHRICTF